MGALTEKLAAILFPLDDVDCPRCAAFETLARQVARSDVELAALRDVVDKLQTENRVLRAKLENAEAGVLGTK
jgi:hypothetical protein